PRSLRERMALHDAPLSGIDVLPALVVALFPLAMRDDEDTNARGPGCGVDRTQVVEQAYFFRDLLETWPEKAALGQEVVVGIDQQQGRGVLPVLTRRHRTLEGSTIPLRQACLPPCLGLNAVGEAARLVLEGDAAHEAAKPVGPAGVGDECTEHGPAEELPARCDLRGQGVLAEPALVLARAALGVVETGLEREGDMPREEDLRPRADRHPLVPAVLGVAVASALVDEDRHDG